MDAEEARRLLGANIRAFAKRRQMSLNRLADFAAVNRPHLLRVVSGKADATIGWLVRVANALEVELHMLVMPREERSSDALLPAARTKAGKEALFRKALRPGRPKKPT